jgi:hypothetical protein
MTNLGKDQKGRWTAGGSANSGGMREGFDSQLSKEDKKILDGIRIQVTDSLELVVKINSEEILRIAYREDPLFELEQITQETDGIGRVHKYQEQPGLTLSGVNIATTDVGKFDDSFRIDALPYDVPSAAHIEYVIPGDVFRVSLISANCCASQELTFKRVKH